MVYRAIGLMSGSSLDGLDIAFSEFHEVSGKWNYEIKAASCYPYEEEWISRLKNAITLNALDYQLLHAAYGHHLGYLVNRFIQEHNLQHQVQLIASHGHTTFHVPAKKMTAQLGDGAAIAAVTGINVVSDLRAMDVAKGGQGAPIVPAGERLLLGDYDYFLNIGGIANISVNDPERYIAFDICAANRVLNMLAETDQGFDEGGKIASGGMVDEKLLSALNGLEYYTLPYPKSLANDFGTDIVYAMIRNKGIDRAHALRTYVEHIALQIRKAIESTSRKEAIPHASRLLITGGGAHNHFLIERIRHQLEPLRVEAVTPSRDLIDFKEAVVMALIGILRWREENNVFASVTGASADSIGGAVWIA